MQRTPRTRNMTSQSSLSVELAWFDHLVGRGAGAVKGGAEAMSTVSISGWSARRQRAYLGFLVALFATAAVITLGTVPDAVHQTAMHPQLWLMALLAVLAGSVAFVAAGPGGLTTVICPAVCFSFAIFLCWGPGPAILAQAATVIGVTWRLRRPALCAAMSAAQYSVAFGAAALVLLIRVPDPFEHNGPTNILADALAVLAMVTVWLAVFAALSYLRARLAGTGSRHPYAMRMVANQNLFLAALVMLSPVLAVAAHINIAFVPLVFIPLYALQRMARLSAERDRAARTDPLTNLANRVGLKARFDELSASVPRNTGAARISLLMLDLDRFKQVNDALGHDTGDQLLVALAGRLAALEPPGGAVARLGGDEFAIVGTFVDRLHARTYARTVVEELGRPLSLDGLRVDVTASVGIAEDAGERDDFATLMRHADVAMYDAKRRGDTVSTYEASTDQNSPERLALLNDFRRALESGEGQEIAMHYQPQVNLATGKVEAVEALLRWHHPSLGLVNTQKLLAVAEHSSVMHLLTAWVVDDVLGQLAGWNAMGIELRASLNVSARDLYGGDLVSHLAERLAWYGVDPGQLQIEITESALMLDPIRARLTVSRISRLGVAVALDDFGTGYSSLQHLRKLPIAEIKIDRAFVSGMAGNRDDAAIVRSTIDMAGSLGLRTVAEGVETEYTRRLLGEAGCTLAQGWLTARPMAAADLTRWLIERPDLGIPAHQPGPQLASI